MPRIIDRIAEALSDAKRDVESATVEAMMARSAANYYEALSHVENAIGALHEARGELQRLAGVEESH